MRKLSKTFMMMIMLLCMFSYMGVVSAQASKLADVEKNSISAVSNLLTGKELSSADKAKITALKDKYSLYYQYQVIDADTYSKYKAGDDSAEDAIVKMISDPASKEDLTSENGWSAIEGEQISYSDLEYDVENPTGYIVIVMAAANDGTIYSYKNVYQATSATTLATYSSVAKSAEINDDVEKEDTIEKEDTTTEEADTEDDVEDTEEVEKSEKNPETGISDFAIYLVPLALIAGSTLYLKRRNA